MKKVLILLSLVIAGVLVSFGRTPEEIRREFSGNLPVIKQNVPKKIADGVTWSGLDYKPEKNQVVLTYKYDNIHSTLQPDVARQFYETNLGTLRQTYLDKKDPLVNYAVDGGLTLRFVYLTAEGNPIATFDYPASALKD